MGEADKKLICLKLKEDGRRLMYGKQNEGRLMALQSYARRR